MRRAWLTGPILAIALLPACGPEYGGPLGRPEERPRAERPARPTGAGTRFYLAGADEATSAAMAARGVETMHDIYQFRFGERGADGAFTTAVDLDRLRRYVETNVPRGFSGVIHFNYEHPSVVSLMQSNDVPATDPRLQTRVREFRRILALMDDIRPQAQVGNWGFFQVEKWLPDWVEKPKAGPRRWDTISERDRQRLFDKWRDPALAPLWTDLDVLMPHAYRAHDEREKPSWRPLISAWIDATLEITTEIAAKHGPMPVVLHFNVRFSGTEYFGRAIPRDQMWETIEKCLEAGVDCAAWGLDSADWYWFESDVARRAKFRAVVTPELRQAGVNPRDDEAVRAYFRRWSLDTATWIADRIDAWQRNVAHRRRTDRRIPGPGV